MSEEIILKKEAVKIVKNGSKKGAYLNAFIKFEGTMKNTWYAGGNYGI